MLSMRSNNTKLQTPSRSPIKVVTLHAGIDLMGSGIDFVIVLTHDAQHLYSCLNSGINVSRLENSPSTHNSIVWKAMVVRSGCLYF